MRELHYNSLLYNSKTHGYFGLQELLDELELLPWYHGKEESGTTFEVRLKKGSGGYGVNIDDDCRVLPFKPTSDGLKTQK